MEITKPVDLKESDKWPNHDLILQGSVSKGFDRIQIIRGGEMDVWRIKTRRIDNSGFDYDWTSSKWAGVDFNPVLEPSTSKHTTVKLRKPESLEHTAESQNQ